ncbi:hypothetical protein [Pseudoalteromonas sp. SW0106-04]|uniref:hypothetical protein n=1 Tax=Pseudoalteromonas sp. SW0106-04 TaxID=1702169 RepID=UPI000AEE7A9A|nr:hypothetical protein [Pseudoalteromonas sp. SW0106-04]
MLIGKVLILSLIAGAFVSSPSIAGETSTLEPNKAWWTVKKFCAEKSNITKLPVSKLNPDWEYITVFDKSYLEETLPESQYLDIQSSPLKFSIRANLDDEPSEERIIVGVYKTKSAQQGRFLAILRDSSVVKVFTHQGGAGYSSLSYDGEAVRWYKCMQCSDYDSIFWSGTSFTLN